MRREPALDFQPVSEAFETVIGDVADGFDCQFFEDGCTVRPPGEVEHFVLVLTGRDIARVDQSGADMKEGGVQMPAQPVSAKF